jgi:hypothetical protein
MAGLASSRRIVRWSLLGFVTVCLLALAAAASAQNQADAPLASAIPAEGLTAFVEHEGFASHPVAWKRTAIYRMLHETSLGTMLEEIITQGADYVLGASDGGPLDGKELVAVLEHLAEKGFAIGFATGPPGGRPKSAVIVIRDAADSDVFKRVLGRMRELNQPAAHQVEAAGGRKLWLAKSPGVRWWFEGKNFVLTHSADPEANPALDALLGKLPSALKHPSYAPLDRLEAGGVPSGRLFVDVSALPPLTPRAGELGLGGIRRVEARWGIEGEGVMLTLGVRAPRPRSGVLALFDQPPIQSGTTVVLPEGAADYTLVSIDLLKLADAATALIEHDDPDAAESRKRFAARFRERTGLSLRDDVLPKIGPRMALLRPGGGGGSLISMWFHPPDFALVAELKDARGFSATLDRLMEAANRELKSAGAMVPRQEGQLPRDGTEFAEFRRLKGPDQGYILAVPPSVLPTPAGLRPTLLIEPDRSVLVVAGSPAAARRARSALVLSGPPVERAWARDAVVFSRNDPRGSLPELLASLPSLVQFIGFAVTQRAGPAGPAGPVPGLAGRAPFRLAIDPDTIPDADELRKFLFPSRFSLVADDDSIRITSYQAFPVPAPTLDVGMETPILIGLLLPAVQSAREAARRVQCVNNLKQIALAFHNYASATDGFPAAAITSGNGKPLLSWRVTILPYLDQKPLYDKFRLDEPWDSPHNKELLKYMPNMYACPSSNLSGSAGLTTYRVFSGGNALLARNRLTRLGEVTDGLSNTLMVVEAKQAVPWTMPDELPVDARPGAPSTPLFGAGSAHPGGFDAAMADGSVRFIKSSIQPRLLHSLITKSGGEVIDFNSF